MSVPGAPAGDDQSDTESHVSFDEDQLPDGTCTDYSRVFPGPWSREDERRLLELGWKERSNVDKFWWKRFVPYWTSPTWDPKFEITVDGTKIRAARGDARTTMRPAILPADERMARTSYTRRWGVNPSVPKGSNGESRSGLTPITGETTTSLDTTGPGTTEEPPKKRYPSVGATLLPKVLRFELTIHSLLHRDKWTQEPLPPQQRNNWKGKYNNFELRYNLGGTELKYDVKVPREKDGRTAEQKQQPDYREYRSLWPDMDRRKMYPSARRLYDLSVNLIWPLLVDQYTESEKIGYRVKIAMVILHELAHACNFAHSEMLQYPKLVLNGIPGLRVSPRMEQCLINLGEESIGSQGRWSSSNQYFFQDEVFLEEGKAFDNQFDRISSKFIAFLDTRSINILRECLQTTHQHASQVLEKLRVVKHNMAMDTSSRFPEIAQDCQTMYVRILADVTALDMVIQLLRGPTAGGRPDNRGPLASVPIVRHEKRESTNLQQAALRAYSQIPDRKVQRIIRTWLNLLSVNEDLRNDTRSAIDEAEGRPVARMKRAREEQTGIVLALQYLDRQEQLEANKARGLQTTAEDDQVDTELLDAMDDSGIVNMHGHLFTEEDQRRLKRRRIR
ncbi:hypothetical protein LA080_005365 [Diaporthe eres]|nr:hypothetical protein LA080_005365 [Diaporthe eres]